MKMIIKFQVFSKYYLEVFMNGFCLSEYQVDWSRLSEC